jgi:cob(I)alamin adenosyltransferase
MSKDDSMDDMADIRASERRLRKAMLPQKLAKKERELAQMRAYLAMMDQDWLEAKRRVEQERIAKLEQQVAKLRKQIAK